MCHDTDPVSRNLRNKQRMLHFSTVPVPCFSPNYTGSYDQYECSASLWPYHCGERIGKYLSSSFFARINSRFFYTSFDAKREFCSHKKIRLLNHELCTSSKTENLWIAVRLHLQGR
jgi:hypothetical protein